MTPLIHGWIPTQVRPLPGARLGACVYFAEHHSHPHHHRLMLNLAPRIGATIMIFIIIIHRMAIILIIDSIAIAATIYGCS